MELRGRNFSKKCKMHTVCSCDDLRPEMSYVYFINGSAYATNGIMLVKNRISEISSFSEEEIEALNGKSIHRDFYKDMLKYDDVLITDEGVECHKKDEKAFFYFTTFEEDKIPKFENVIQEVLNMQSVPLPQIGFNINLMNELSKSLCESERCKVTFKGIDKAMIVESANGMSSSIGLLMPIREY